MKDFVDIDDKELAENQEETSEIDSEILNLYNDYMLQGKSQEFNYLSAKEKANEVQVDLRNAPIEGNGGHWEGERGESKWLPEKDEIPSKSNSNNLTWGEIMEKYDIDGIAFCDGEPDFSEITTETVEIEDFSSDRSDNFDQADEMLADCWNCSPKEVVDWRKENGYTWHECRDCLTMQLVPTEIHNNISHRGGVSKAKEGGL